jgi:hypothetical protein
MGLKLFIVAALLSRFASATSLEQAQALMDAGNFRDAGVSFATLASASHSPAAAHKACSCLTQAKDPAAVAWCAYADKLERAMTAKAVPAPPEDDGEALPHAFSEHPELQYHPASPDAPLALRLASYEALHVRGFNDDGYAEVGDHLFKVTEQGHYYKNAGADDAFELYREGQRARTVGIVWFAAGLGGGAILGYVVGAVVGLSQVEGQLNNTGNTTAATNTLSSDEGLGLLGGAVLGLAIGGTMALMDMHERTELRHKAADAFNNTLMEDLKLDIKMIPGGAKVGIGEEF